MRYVALLLLLLAVAVSPALADQASAIADVKSKPRVLDALVDTGGNLYVIVKNDKLPWDQYAALMCQVVRPHQARIFVVKVVDVTSIAGSKRPGLWKALAKANCAQ